MLHTQYKPVLNRSSINLLNKFHWPLAEKALNIIFYTSDETSSEGNQSNSLKRQSFISGKAQLSRQYTKVISLKFF